MKRIIYLALFISTLPAIAAIILYFIPHPHHLNGFKKGIEILLLIFSTWILLRLLNRFIWPGIREKFKLKISHLFVVILNILILLTLFFIITLGVLGLDLTIIVTASSLVTAGLAFALQGIITDIAAAIIIDLDRLYKIGDWIKLDETIEGKVINIGWRHTEIITLQNTSIIINNGKMLNTPVQNFNRFANWAVDEFQISISHNIPSHRVKRIVETALQRHNEASKYYAQTLARTLDSGGVNYFVRYGIEKPENRWALRHNIINALRQELHAYGLRISEGLGEYGIFRGNQPLIEEEFFQQQEQILHWELFQGFSKQQFKELLSLSPPLLLPENSVVIHKGDLDETLYLIGEGTVAIHLTNQETRLLHSGDYFGEQSFLLNNPRNADVIAKTDVVLYKYSKTGLMPLLKGHPTALKHMVQVMIKRSKELEKAITTAKRTSKNETLEEIILQTVKEFFSA